MSDIAGRDYILNRKFKNPYPQDGLVEYWDSQFNKRGQYDNFHDSNYMKMDSLVGEFPIVIQSGDACFYDNFLQCNCKLHTDSTVFSQDNRQLAFPISLVVCMRYDQYVATAELFRFGNGSDTRVYSQDNMNIRWLFLTTPYDISQMDIKSGELVTCVFMFDGSAVRFWVNDKHYDVPKNTVWAIGNGLNLMGCDTANVKGKFYCSQVYNRVLSDEEILRIQQTNKQRFDQ